MGGSILPLGRQLPGEGSAARRRIELAHDEEGLLRRRSRELAATLAWEMPFWFMLSFWAFGPSVWTPWFVWKGVPLNSKDIALVVVAAWYAVSAVVAGTGRDRRRSGVYGRLPLMVVLLVGYAGASVWWSPMERAHLSGMLLTLVLTVAMFVLAHAMFRGRSVASTRAFLGRVTFFLVLTTVIYGAESLFLLGLRSAYPSSEFGIPRLCGPLFGAATGYLILLPAFAHTLQESSIQTRAGSLGWNLASAGVLLGGLLALGSRGAIVALAAFVALAVCFRRGASKVQVMVLVVILGAVAVSVLTSAQANFERVTHFDCNARAFTHETACRAVAGSTLANNLRGAGYGAYWPWYSRDAWLGRFASDHFLPYVCDTEFGPTLYHPHSVFLHVCVELGLVGLLAFLSLWKTLSLLVLRFGSEHRTGLLCCGMFASAMALFFDTFFFKCHGTSCIWCVYLLGTLRITGDVGGERASPSSARRIGGEASTRSHTRMPRRGRIGARL